MTEENRIHSLRDVLVEAGLGTTRKQQDRNLEMLRRYGIENPSDLNREHRWWTHNAPAHRIEPYMVGPKKFEKLSRACARLNIPFPDPPPPKPSRWTEKFITEKIATHQNKIRYLRKLALRMGYQISK